MGCYCSEIPKCRADIQIIKEVENKFKKIDNYNSNDIKNALNNMASNTQSAVTPSNVDALINEEKIINDNFEEKIKNLISDCQKKITSLENKLEDMISSDRRYHESKDKHKEK